MYSFYSCDLIHNWKEAYTSVPHACFDKLPCHSNIYAVLIYLPGFVRPLAYVPCNLKISSSSEALERMPFNLKQLGFNAVVRIQIKHISHGDRFITTDYYVCPKT